MTRASLLRILDHVNGISDDEIRELEQLAAAFPYCQTAHVLLAKTAHDRGSMLAGQRLRRAATYAADRELLRQLLERPTAPAPTAEPAPAGPTVPTPPADLYPADAVAAAEAAPAASVTTPTVAPPKLTAAPETDLFAVAVVSAPAQADETAGAAEVLTDYEALTLPEVPATAQDTAAADTPANAGEPTATHELSGESAVDEPVAFTETAPAELPEAEKTPDEVQPAPAETATDPEEPLITASATTEPEEASNTSNEAAEEAPVAEEAVVPVPVTADEEADELLPAVAPPIRPPSGAGISRFEFGLGEPRLPEPTGYRLGFAEEEEELAAEEDELSASYPAPPSRITAPFRADAELGYALGGGSRLGYDLQGRTPDGFTLDLPLEAFFEPDALLLAHARAHQPAPKTSSLDLINRFLKAQPRIKAGGTGATLPAAEQADLSVRSSAAAPALASESLAKIMVRQGKMAKAIEIYERLMAKQPEKMAYFAQQIQQLQQPPE